MKYNTQTDSNWKKDIMTEGKINNIQWIDRIGRWGCVVTCLANIEQAHSGIEFTPRNMNNLIVGHNGYWILSGKTDKESNASFVDWDVVKGILLFDVFNDVEYKEGYNIARVILNGGGHYINIIKKEKDLYLCFDVNDGELKYYKESDIKKIIRIEFM